jgi:hypothetical protein
VRLALIGLAVLLLAARASAAAAPSSLDRPSRSDLSGGPVRDLEAAAAIDPQGYWGGEYTTRTNERVRIFSSPRYAVDDAANQRWAEFLASLLHGPELAAVTVYLAPPAEVARLCGGSAEVRGCYSNGRILGLGEDADLTAEAVLAHEYGHHVAANRSNAPWPASGWGTKRWASYLDVCRRVRAHELWPGSQGPLLYEFNPGEGFAEAYRLLNERRAGVAESPWQIVDETFLPDARAFALLEQDVVDPWHATTAATFGGRFTTRGSRVRTFRVTTPLDGTLTASVAGAPRARVDVVAGKRVVAHGGTGVESIVCAARTSTLRVTRVRGAGSFTLTVVRPG